MNQREKTILVEGAINGDKKALARLVEHKFKDILYFALSKSGKQEAEDIVQESIVNIYKDISKLNDPGKFDNWVISVVYHRFLNHMTKLRREQEKTADSESEVVEKLENTEFLPEDYILDGESREEVIEIIRGLPEFQSTCILMYYCEGMKPAEIAEVLEVDVRKISTALYRGRNNLKEVLEKVNHRQFTFALLPAGATPVLSRVLATDKQSVANSQWGEAVWNQMQIQLAEMGIELPAPKKIAQVSTPARVAAGLVTAGVLAVGVMYFMSEKDVSEEEVRRPAVTAETVQTISEPETEEPEEPQQEMRIETVSDMIGTEDSAILEGYAAGEIGVEEWDAFVVRIGANPRHTASDGDYEYQKYVLEKQDKRLTLAERRSADGEVRVIYYFGSQTEAELDMSQVVLLFDGM